MRAGRNVATLTPGDITRRIIVLREQKVLLDSDLAALCGVDTRRLHEQVKPNRELAAKVHVLERKVTVHERTIAELVDSMAELLATPPPPPKRSIGFMPQEDRKGSNGRKRQHLRQKNCLIAWCTSLQPTTC
jgi:hypothetical protein